MAMVAAVKGIDGVMAMNEVPVKAVKAEHSTADATTLPRTPPPKPCIQGAWK
jgi:hypothetical protein